MAVPLVFEVAFVFILVSSLKTTEAQIDAQLRRQAMVEQTSVLYRELVDATVFFYNSLLSRQSVDTRQARASIAGTLKNIDELVGEDGQLKTYARDMRVSSTKFVAMLEGNSHAPIPQLLENFTSGGSLSKEIRQGIQHLDFSERDFAKAALDTGKNPSANEWQEAHLFSLILLGVLLNFLLTVVLALSFARNISSRLHRLAENTRRVSCSSPPLPVVSGNDEISNLDLVIHRMADQLQQDESQRKQLTAMLHSKLQKPLARARRVFCDLQDSASLPPAATNLVKKSSAQLQRLISLLDDLVCVGEIGRAEITLSRKEICSDEIVVNAIEEMQNLAKKKKLSITRSGPGVTFFGDEQRLTQLLINLLSNAVKYSPKESDIVVKVTQLEQEIEFRVIDQGPGIPEAQRSKIFERFEQTKRADATHHGGSGLGLNICMQIAGAHGGVLGVDSEEGKSSEFWLKMPVSKNAQDAARRADEARASALAAAGKRGNARSSKVWHKGLMVVVVPLLFQVLFLSVLNTMIAKSQLEASQEMQSMKISCEANKLYKNTVSLGTSGIASYLGKGNAEDAKNYKLAVTHSLEHFCNLFEAERTDQVASRQLRHIFHESNKLLILTGMLMLEPSPDFSKLNDLIGLSKKANTIQKNLSSVSGCLLGLLDYQKQIELKSPKRRAQTNHSIEILVLGAVAVSVLLSLFLGLFFSRNISKRVEILTDNTLRFTKKQELLPPLAGNDELNSFDKDFRLMVKKLEDNQEFMRQIIAVVSHELRAPLANIVGSLELILAGAYGVIADDACESMRSAHDDMWRVVQLVNDLLDIEKMEAGKYPLEISTFNIRQSAERAVAQAKKSLPGANFVIKNGSIADESSLFVESDSELSTKAIVKLLVFCGEGQTTDNEIELKLGDRNGFVVVEIIDPFNVITRNAGQTNVKFQLVEESPRRAGVALSLALSRTIITLLGGRLSASAPLDNGSGYFEILLPKIQADR